jgi:Ser/Thr protein kinase RdoA (MazF antagonist)
VWILGRGNKNMQQTPAIRHWMKSSEKEFRKKAKNFLFKAAKIGILPDRKIDKKHLKVFQKGSRSVVFCVNYGRENPYVVKMGNAKETIEAESAFLKRWNEAGVRVPKIIKRHLSNRRLPVSLTVMEYVDAPILSDVMDTKIRIKSGISFENGIVLARMHKVKGRGFGLVKSGRNIRGKFSSFRKEIEDNLFKMRIPELIEAGLLNLKIYEPLNKAIDMLDKETKSKIKPSFTHNDFRPYNMFYDKGQVIVFDPNPKITHPYMCLSLTLIKSLIETEKEIYGKKEYQEILRGYESVSKIDKKSLQAAFLVRSIMNMHIWWKKEEKEKLRKLQILMKGYERAVKKIK